MDECGWRRGRQPMKAEGWAVPKSHGIFSAKVTSWVGQHQDPEQGRVGSASLLSSSTWHGPDPEEVPMLVAIPSLTQFLGTCSSEVFHLLTPGSFPQKYPLILVSGIFFHRDTTCLETYMQIHTFYFLPKGNLFYTPFYIIFPLIITLWRFFHISTQQVSVFFFVVS